MILKIKEITVELSDALMRLHDGKMNSTNSLDDLIDQSCRIKISFIFMFNTAIFINNIKIKEWISSMKKLFLIMNLFFDVLPGRTRMIVANPYPNFRLGVGGAEKWHDGLPSVVSHAIHYQFLRT